MYISYSGNNEEAKPNLINILVYILISIIANDDIV